MKKLLSAILGVFLVAILAHSAVFTIGWNPNPPLDAVTGYRLYSLSGTNRTLLASVASTNALLTLTDGIYALAATATNIVGESALSLPLYVVVSGTNVLAITIAPGAPIGLQLR